MRRKFVLVLVLLSICIILTSCSDMLSKIAEQSNVQVSFTSSSLPNLHIDQDATITLSQDGNITFVASVDSEESLTYRWYLDGQELETETTNLYTLEGSTLSEGTYILKLCVLIGEQSNLLVQSTITVEIRESDN